MRRLDSRLAPPPVQSMKRCWVVVFVAASGLMAASADAADPPSEKAAAAPTGGRHHENGMLLYNIRDWGGAIRELKAAYEEDRNPDYLYTLAQAQRLSGDCASAILTYSMFLREVTGSAAVAAEGFVHVCEAQLKEREAAAKSHAEPVAVLPPPAPHEPAVGPASPPAPAPRSPASWYRDPLGDTLAVAGVGALAAGSVLLVEFGTKLSAAKGAPSDRASQSAWDAAKPDAVAGGVASAAGALVLAGAIWRYVAVSSGARGAPPSVGLSVGPGRLQLSYGREF